MRPPIDPRPGPLPGRPTWRGILVGYALVLAVPALLWAISQPVTAGVAAAGLLGGRVATRRGVWFVRCLRDCGAVSRSLGCVRITVSRPGCDVAGRETG
jgi:hypothetical protein